MSRTEFNDFALGEPADSTPPTHPWTNELLTLTSDGRRVIRSTLNVPLLRAVLAARRLRWLGFHKREVTR